MPDRDGIRELLLLQYLRAARWNVTQVARPWGLSRTTVYRQMKRCGLREPEEAQGRPG